MLFSLIELELNTSWPSRNGNRTYSNFLNMIFLLRSNTVDTWKRMALEPISMAANFKIGFVPAK